ncbi:MAG: DMT family transporter [Thiohalocapsa sp.]
MTASPVLAALRAPVNPERLAIQLMIAQGALFAAETALIHQIGTGASVVQLALIRGGAGLTLALVLASSLGLTVLRTAQLRLQVLRGLVSLCYLWVMIYSFRHLPLADATAISFTQAGYIALFSVMILGERVGARRWTAAAIGMVGALLIAKPAFAGWHPAYLVVLGGTSLNGLAFVLNRYLQQRDSDVTTLFYTNLVAVLGNLPALGLAAMPEAGSLALLPGLLLFGPIGMYLGIVAVKHTGAATLGPYTLLRLCIGVLGGIALFREVPDFLTLLGVGLIVGSCVLSSHRPADRRIVA